MFNHTDVKGSFFAAFKTIGVLPALIWLIFDGNEFSFHTLLPYYMAAAVGLLLGLSFWYIALRRLKKMRVIVVFIAMLSLAFLVRKLGLDVQYSIDSFAIYGPFLVTCYSVAEPA